MKKLYAFFAAALMSASLFAAAPTAADLAKEYDVNANVVFCIQFIEDAEVCNDIRFVGTPNNWGKGEPTGTDPETGDPTWNHDEGWDYCEKFQPVPGFDGWYAAELPYSDGFEGKPLQEPTDRSWTWDYQCGDMDAWVHVDGLTLNLEAGYAGECNIKASAAGAYIYQLKYWKNHKSPCVAVVKHNYTIKMYAPDACADMKPAIIGDFNSWKEGVAMNEELDDDFETVYTYTFEDQEGHGFKIKEAKDTDWSNQMQYYVPEDTVEDKAGYWTNFDNYELGADSVIVLEWGDNDNYRFALCTGEPIDTTAYYTIVAVNVPAGAPAAGVEIIGSFDGWSGTAMELLNTGWWFAEIYAQAGQEFKFREAGTWANEIVYVQKISEEGTAVGLDNIKFGDIWSEDSWKGDPCKSIELDFSDSTVYCWKTDWVAPQGIENVVLTEKAQKVVVDGVLYIVRDNKMYNVQGVMVRKE